MRDWALLCVLGLTLPLAACQKQKPASAAVESVPTTSAPDAGGVNGGFAGHDPPPLADLVEQATEQAAPIAEPTPYAPKMVEVPALVPEHVEQLPVSANGDPVVSVNGDVGLVVDESLSDPITASARCMQLTTSCVQPASVEGGRTRDSCVASARECATNHPWNEEQACCPRACQELYKELRLKDYADWEAWGLVRRSDCFPGMREFMQAAADADQQDGLTP